MAGRQLAFAQPGLHLFRQIQQPHRVGDVGAGLAHLLGDLFLGPVERRGHQLVIGHRLFQRIQVGALDVLDDCDFQRLAVGHLAHHHRHVMQLGQLGGPPAAFARHDLIAVGAQRAHQDGRQHALFFYGCRQVGQRLFVEGLARLVLARLQECDRQRARVFFGDRLALHGSRLVTNQCRKPAAQSARPINGRVHAAARMRSRWISSPASLM